MRNIPDNSRPPISSSIPAENKAHPTDALFSMHQMYSPPQTAKKPGIMAVARISQMPATRYLLWLAENEHTRMFNVISINADANISNCIFSMFIMLGRLNGALPGRKLACLSLSISAG